MAHGGTYCGNAVGAAAAMATLDILATTEALETTWSRGKALMSGIHQILEEAGIEHALTGHPAMFGFVLGTSKTPREYRDVMQTDMAAYEKICASMREKGIEYEQDPREPWFVCAAHSEADVGEALEALRDTVKKRKRAR